MVLKLRLFPLLAALVATSCAMPGWLAPSQKSTVPPPNLTATARLSFSLPHASPRGVAVYQTTVEPENLIQGIDHFSLILDSVSGSQTVSKTISKAEAAEVAVDGLVAAADWTLEVKAWADAGESTLVGRFYADTGLSTTPGNLTVLGDLTVAPVPGAATSPFRIEIPDFPSGLAITSTDFDLDELAPDGTATAVAAGVKANVTLSRNQSLVVIQSAGIATGTYRLVLKPKDGQGQPASFSPLFVINLFPNLTSSKSFSAAAWNLSPSTATIAAATPVAGWSALVLGWTTDSPSLFSGYEWVWHPGVAGDDIASAATFEPSLVSPLARSGFFTPAGGSVPLSRPHWTLTTDGQFGLDLAESASWTLYVRGVAPGSKSDWIAISVNLRTLRFPIKVSSFQVISTEMAGMHTLIRTSIDPAQSGIQPTSVPVLSAQTFSATHTGDAQTVGLNASWYLAPNDWLTIVDPQGQYRAVKVLSQPSGPGQTTSMIVYEGIIAGVQGYWALDQADLATLGDSRTTDWTVDPKVDNGASAYTPRGRVMGTKSDIGGRPYGSLVVAGYQFKARIGAPLTLDDQELGFLSQTDAQNNGFPGAILNTTPLNTSADVRHFVARVRYTLDNGATIYGPWSSTASDTFWGSYIPDVMVNETNRVLTAGSNWDLNLTGTWTDAQGSDPGANPLQYRYKQAGSYDFSAWNDIALGAPNGAGYDWALTVHFSDGAQGVIQFRVSSTDDAFVESDALDFVGASVPTANLMATGLLNGFGRVTYLAADRQNDGWFAQGFTGYDDNVFLSHWLPGGGHDNTWGSSGSVVTSWGRYFPGGIGFVQTGGSASASAYPTGYRLWMNGFQPSYGRNHFSSYTYDGTVDTSDLLRDWDHGLGRPVIDSTGNIAYLGWYNNDGGAGSHMNKLWVNKLDSTGADTGFSWMLADVANQARDDANRLLTVLAVDGSDRILVAGGKRVLRIDTNASTDTTFGASGVASVNLSDTGDETDIRAIKVGTGVVAGKIYLLVGPTQQNTLDSLAVNQTVATVVRLNSDGSVDTAWGGSEGYRNRPGTIVLPPLFSDARSFDVDGSGNIVVAGRTTKGFPFAGRLLPDGSGPDGIFGGASATNGFVILNDGYGGAAESVAITSGGVVGIGGWVKYSSDDADATPAFWKF